MGVFVILAAALALGQTKPGDQIVTVPFSFSAAGHKFEAGRYIVAAVGDGNLRIYNDKNSGVMAPVHSVHGKAPETHGKLVFHRYGETYFLAEAWVPGNSTGKKLYPSKFEKEVALDRHNTEVAVMMNPR
jgi:hypothetical protein